MLEITRVTTPTAKYPLKCTNAMVPTRIVVHDTANDASAMAEVSYMLSNDNWTSFHFAVDDYRAVQGLPLNRNSWNAGDGSLGIGNRQGISIEVCYSKSGGAHYLKARENAAELCAMLLKEYGWGINKVTKHQDYSGKVCPHRNISMGWSNFLLLVSKKLDILNGKAPSAPAPEPPKIVVGSMVEITGAKYATGQTVPTWAKPGPHKVSQIKGDQVLLGNPGGIVSWVYLKDLKLK